MTRLGQMIWEDGRTEDKLEAYLEMIQVGLLTEENVAAQLKITHEELKKLLEEKLLPIQK